MPSPASAASSASAEPRSSAPALIREIGRGESLKPFIDLSWTINARDPNWVAPLRMVFNQLLNRKKHPFYEHADVAFFVAERGGELVGRIAAIVNHRANEFHGDRTGFFGLFECVDDAGVAARLLDRAAEWLKARGMESMQGPFNLSTNDELYSPGVLVDGFDKPPVFMMGHNPRYYGRLMEAAGMGKAKDLVGMWLGNPDAPPRLVQGMEKLAKREGWRIRSVDMKRFKEEVATVMEVYNAAWERNWGFIPMTGAEFENMAKEFKPVVDPELVLIAETVEGEPIGFALAMPDFNQAFRHLPSGRLFPFGLFKFLWHRRKIRTMRFLTLGLKPGWQASGIGAALYYRVFQVGKAKGYNGCEAGWMLEDNDRMLNGLEKVGFAVYKTYRVYERPL